MTVRKKRSISVPPDLDRQIEAAAESAGTTYSGWLTATARKEFLLQDGLAGVAAYERANGRFTEEELAEAEEWVSRVVVATRRRRPA